MYSAINIDSLVSQYKGTDFYTAIKEANIQIMQPGDHCFPEGTLAMVMDVLGYRYISVRSSLNFHQQRIAVARAFYLHLQCETMKTGECLVITHEDTPLQNDTCLFASKLLNTSVLLKRTSVIV
ncbi:hypothetical protein L2089_15790 [Paenibacillus hunanensis]|uniref:hypothetical protein n=1 Tax=Paenibacillus hunanensis TaxID=539262 RepID=UPI0020274EC7|nr:hypothetical protein [Paenibacillus hunanensis]MCL9662156.1 hypothetical protein [Paenibacillus hunanensis]